MKSLLITGTTISALGLIGLIWCIFLGLRIRKVEKTSDYSDDDLKKLLGRLSTLNMLCLCSSMFGLMILVTGMILI